MTFDRDADGNGTRVSTLCVVRRLVTNGFLVSKRVWARYDLCADSNLMSPSLPNLTLDGRGVVSFEDFVPVFVHGFCLKFVWC